MTKPRSLQALEQPLSSLPDTLRQLILERIKNLTHYEPVIGIMGKSGAGKSSLCNELFRGEVSPVSDVSACTRDVLRFRLRSGRHSLVIVDLPGVGENGQRDQEYRALYRRMLPELDLVLWVIKADDRALSVDEQFWRGVMQPYQQQVLFVLNQADKIEPCHEWDTLTSTPSAQQRVNLQEKQVVITAMFKPCHPVCVVSALTGWGVEAMVATMMRSLPDRATSPVATQLHGRLCTESVRSQARDSFGEAVGRVFDTAESSSFLSAPLKTVMRTVRDAVVSVARAIWNWIFL
ncbi:GTPase family protein [Salmonella enterica subsp. enterica serovar Sandiego]|uniref:GTPase family protein n=1 Tax=Salmonella enterica TaxID=28901 RepID=A0A743IR74_SALER|nr:GTPase family protein [Salmonella enterica subsp. enterica serovar Duisburg]EAA5994096.1 GTPase family protein [Salmonella enterica subsp. enterica serovar Chester]EAO4083981.1 GTPase family protein [Salmonella enterica]EBG6811823.1 GTPase family protein [Salmonella enterica subsp. enterica]EBV9367952.1 GTPase family protein [Salmonella enterica subsp. enterica serovar Sandiego]EDH0227302.1 GTP-binding protein [Salmonella enterica subsp. enterica serovar Montevideo]